MSNLPAALLLIASSVLMGLANLCVKSAINRAQGLGASLSFVIAVARQPMFILGLLLVAIASVVWMRVLSLIGLTTAYPVFVSLTYAVVAIGAIMLFGERLSAQKLLGTAFLIAGIFFISRG
jgi:multidrug transporter EmrE-like cation transporter